MDKEISKRRLSNIELLRIICLIMVILSHYYCHSGFPEDSFISFNKVMMQFMASGGKVAVDVFVIITGYFCVTQIFRWRKVLKFLLCTYFWSVVILIFAICILPYNVSSKSIIESLCPFTPLNWFARAYLLLYLFTPVINKIINKVSKRTLSVIIFILTFTFFVWPTMRNYSLGGYFYSFLMFVNMYFIGAVIRLYSNEILERRIKYLGIFSTCFMAGSILLFNFLGLSDPYYLKAAHSMYFEFSGASIFALLVAIWIFTWFNKNCTLKYSYYINKIASTTFAVYLIHDNALIKQWLWCDIVKGYVFYKTDFLVIHMIVVTCIIFIVCSVLELFRIRYVEGKILK